MIFSVCLGIRTFRSSVFSLRGAKIPRSEKSLNLCLRLHLLLRLYNYSLLNCCDSTTDYFLYTSATSSCETAIITELVSW